MRPEPFEITIDQARLDAIMARVGAFEWQEAPAGGGWAYGASLDYMRGLVDHWRDAYDWRRAVDALNAWPQFTAEVEGLRLHFYHVKGRGPAPKALLISHGWPGSVFEFLHLIGRLTDPAAHGGDPADAFDVVIPSLPGYGHSGKPDRPIGPRRVAFLFNRLMTEVLGYARYIAQGGDWGSAISTWAGFDHPDQCRAVHLNMVGIRPTPDTPNTPEEARWSQEAQVRFRLGGAYLLMQATRPLTLSYAMSDSPVGAAAWIIEKFHAWSDCKGDIETRFTKDQLLTNVMIYLTTRSFQTATWLYRGLMEEGTGALPEGRRVEVPVGVADFPGDEIYRTPPRSFVERAYNVVHWTSFTAGGHFAAMEEPEAWLGDVRAFARKLG